MDKKTIKQKIKVGVITAVLITIIVLTFSLSNIILGKENIVEKITKYGLPSLFTISLLLDMIPQILSPLITLSLAIIAGIKVQLAVPTVILGSTIGASISYTIGKKYMFLAVSTITKDKKAKQLTHLINKYGKIIVPIAALSPLPYLPVVIGSMNMNKKNFIIYGLIPRAISFIVYGLATHYAII